jgi:hypothetical protein
MANSPDPHAAESNARDGVAIRQQSERLRHKGFHQAQVTDPNDGHPAWMWSRLWNGVRDAVIASGVGAIAYRIPEQHFDPREPFTVDPDRYTWFRQGDFIEVSTALLALESAPGHFRSASG